MTQTVTVVALVKESPSDLMQWSMEYGVTHDTRDYDGNLICHDTPQIKAISGQLAYVDQCGNISMKPVKGECIDGFELFTIDQAGQLCVNE
jgi:hypothetical protein